MMADVEGGAATGRGPATPGTRVLQIPDDAGRERVDRFVADAAISCAILMLILLAIRPSLGDPRPTAKGAANDG